ncbi:conjugal transfer mating-pair stabilization protein TraG [Pantoea dispersa]|uniref:conjugal transfer mating-pair stabilization protein TraG n=2 Tax=Pantoea TaxID=53335 RepID=UPI00123C76BB|nr:conjugal transfer mating-pair stabilization protein TraG [Pantoea dispersa]KAA8669043.1 conjugal transfer mating pair stabilization protein TraG [Pantoea dispersa]
MTEVWTIYGGDMWRQVFNGVVTVIGAGTFTTLLRIVGLFGVLGVVVSFVKTRNPMVFLYWLAVFMFITSALLVPKRSVQIHDITDPAAVYEVDNVPAGLAMIAGLSTGAGFGVAQLYDYTFARPDSLTYTKSGMLFGSQVVAQTTDFRSQNPQLAQMLTDYVENCVVGDILLNNKYTVSQLLNSTDPLTLITDNPSPLRGLYQDTGGGRQFITCQQAAAVIKNLIGADVRIGGTTWHKLATRVFGSRVSADSLLGNAMDESYNFFYAGGLSASQIMRNNITNAAIRDGWKGFAARSSDTANLVNLATESSLTKQRLSWASFGTIMGRMLPMFQSLLMLILIALFPMVIALALVNHTIFGLNTLKIYAGGFLYFQMWPVMYAILNSLANFYLQTKTGTTALVLSNQDQVALQHSDAANIAGYLSASIPVLSFYLTKGAGAIASQVAGSVISSAAFTTGGQASTTADGNWSFNNMSMDNVSANKFDTNMLRRSGSQSVQTGNNAMMTQTADGHTVVDTSQAISNLPVSMRLSSLASSGFSEQARQAEQQAQSSLDGYNHSVTSGFQQLNQLTQQSGNSDSVTQGSDNSVATNISKGTSQMQSAVEGYAKANHISQQEAYSRLSNAAVDQSVNAGVSGKFDSSKTLWGKAGEWAVGVSGEAHLGAEKKGSLSDQHGVQDSHSAGTDLRQDKNSQYVRDFRQGVDMVTSTRLSESGSHTDNQSNSLAQQFAATLNDAKSQYHQYTESSTRSQEFSRMATLSQTQSASLDANYNQEFVDWTTAKYGSDAQNILTNVRSAQGAATEFMHERLEPEIMRNYATRSDQVNSEPLQPTRSPDAPGAGAPLPAGGYAGSGSQGGIREHQSGLSTERSGGAESSEQQNGRDVLAGESQAPHSGIRRVTAADVHDQERHLSVPADAPSQTMTDNFHSGSQRVSEEASGAGIQSNVADRVAAQRSGLMETVRDNDGKIAENKTTVQTSSDILKGEHDKGQGQFARGFVTEQGKQKLWTHTPENKEFEEKLQELRRRTGN